MKPSLILDHHRGFHVEGIGTYGKGKEKWIVVLEKFHVGEPFTEDEVVNTLDVAREVVAVSLRDTIKAAPVGKLFCEVKDGAQKVREGLVLHEHRVFKETYKKITPFHEKTLEDRKVHKVHLYAESVVS